MDLSQLHNREAEQSVLGGLMLKNNAWDDVNDLICERDFFISDHQVIFNAMKQLEQQRKPFDMVTLSSELKKMKELDAIGGDIYLINLLKDTPTAANICSYAEIVKKMSLRRQIVIASQKAISTAFDLRELNFVDEAKKIIGNVMENNSESARDEKDYPDATFQKIMEDFHSEKTSVYLPTGFSELDDLIGGFEYGSYVILAARPSMGKTTLAMNIADNIAKLGKSVLVFSLETTTENLQERRLARHAIVKLEKIKTRKSLSTTEISNLSTATHEHSQMKIVMDDCEKIKVTANYIRSQCRRVKNSRGLDLVLIDYVQLIHANEGDNDISKLGYISRDLRALAKELNICILVLSQLNRNVESRTDKRPMMSDLKQSGSLEQDANMIIFIDRPCRHPGNENTDATLANIYVEKNKDGKTGEAKLKFLGEYCTFTNYQPHENNSNNVQQLKPLKEKYQYK